MSSSTVSSHSVVAVTGVTGHLGGLILNGLKQKVSASQLVGLVRDTNKTSKDKLGAEVRPFDYNKEEQLAESLKGVQVLVLVSSSEFGKRVAQHTAVIQAAKKAGVQHVIYTSLLYATTTLLAGLASDHVATEKLLAESGLQYTVLRNGWYYENITASIGGVLASNSVFGSAADGIFSSASRKDYADAATQVVVDLLAKKDAHNGKIYELAGEHGFTLAQYAAEIAKQTQKDIKFVNLPEADYAAALAKFGLPEVVAQLIAHSDVQASKGALQVKEADRKVLASLIGRSTTTLAEAVQQGLAALKA